MCYPKYKNSGVCMAFFDESFLKKDNSEEKKNINPVNNQNNNNIAENSQTSGGELEVNKKNREAYEKLMQESKSKYDMYYDRGNVFVRLFLFALFVFIVVGVVYYLLKYLAVR